MLAASVLLGAYQSKSVPHTPATTANSKTTAVMGLKDYYQSYFPIGVAVSPQALQGPEAELIMRSG